MRKPFVLALVASFAFFTVQAQIAMEPTATPSKFQPSYFGISGGIFGDTYFNLDLDRLETRINDNDYKRADVSGFNSYDYAVSNVGLSGNFTLRFDRSPVSNGIYNETEVGLGVVVGREILIDYYNEDGLNYESVTFCDMQNEVSVFSNYKVGYSFMNILKFYTGVGANLGSSVGDQFWVFKNTNTTDANGEVQYSNTEEAYNTKNSMFMRAYVPMGAELVAFNKFHIGAEARFGYGRQQVLGGQGFGGVTYATMLTTGWSF